MAQSRPLHDYDAYIARLFAQEDPALRTARERQDAQGLPSINVSAVEGRLLQVLAHLCGARRILEIGTLGGYSATWLARALPEDGKLISLEIDPHHADVARTNLQEAGLADKVEIRVGPALETLDHIRQENAEPFDLAFIDADKEAYVDYLEKVVPLVREGGLILADNVLQNAAFDPQEKTGISRYNKAIAAHPDLVSIAIPMLREHIDGLAISWKRTKGQ